MHGKITRFLSGGLALARALCIGVFGALAIYLNRQSGETISELGNLYMGQYERPHFQAL